MRALAIPLVFTNKPKLLLELLVFVYTLVQRIIVGFAAGAMVFVSVDELVNLAYEHDEMYYFAVELITRITSILILSTFF